MGARPSTNVAVEWTESRSGGNGACDRPTRATRAPARVDREGRAAERTRSNAEVGSPGCALSAGRHSRRRRAPRHTPHFPSSPTARVGQLLERIATRSRCPLASQMPAQIDSTLSIGQLLPYLWS